MSEPTSQIAIRRMEPSDAPEVAILIKELGYERDRDQVAQWIESMLARIETQIAFVACLGGQVIGWIEISIEHRLQSPPFALIGGLVVKDGYRNHKLGKSLCEHAEAWTWEQGLTTLRVTSRSTRTDAHRFYLRNGYTLTKISQIFEKNQPK
ncbi:MAG TPA: GNAT family N-acetyltransferase [Terracidiphilus sp.]